MTIVVRCDCGHLFETAGTLAGGFTNCPRCRRAAQVPGLRDPLWRLAQAAGLLLAAGVAAGAGWLAGPFAAVGAGAGAFLLLWLVSRGL
jgi:hypothetical protein